MQNMKIMRIMLGYKCALLPILQFYLYESMNTDSEFYEYYSFIGVISPATLSAKKSRICAGV